MVSNGYLLNSEMILRAVEQWKLREIQITLDGTEEKYQAAEEKRAAKKKAKSDAELNPEDKLIGDETESKTNSEEENTDGTDN